MASSAFLSVYLIISVIVLLSNRCCAFQCGVSYDTITVLNAFPHDPQAFTEGLLYHGNDTLFESTGLYGESSVRKVALRTGKVQIDPFLELFHVLVLILSSFEFPITLYFYKEQIMENKQCSEFSPVTSSAVMCDWKSGQVDRSLLSCLLQLTWTFKYDMKEGWGLATDGKVLFGSDGSSTLYQFEPQPFKVVSKQVVYYKGHQVHNLNELEYINGEVWANVLPTDCIVRISPHDGRVLGWILLQNLRKELVEAGEISDRDILNGIAWDGEQNRIFVTGKQWPKLYEIKVSPIKKPIEEGIIEQLCLYEPLNGGFVLADPAQRE
ncbi:hypothetical protein JHK82_024986 [Glycine max]|nr:hypothetical protein JHK85_025601 [Glycine max]KAG5012841.1 hypothetical protein JHK86_025102 [Glycine max]KAG5133798.1 hypothetical protein JHK82_024986 [Glycine max]